MHAVAHNEIAAAKERIDELRREVSRIYIGSTRALDLMLVSLLARGHVLLEGVPGVAKTTLVKAFATALGCIGAAHPVHARSPARRHHRHVRALAARRARSALRAGPDLRERRARRRDQPRPREDAVGAARGDAGAAGHDRGRSLRAAAPVPRPRDAEPDRSRGHVPAARGADRSLPRARPDGLPDRARRGADAPHARHRAAAARARAQPRPTCCSSRRSPRASTSRTICYDYAVGAHDVHAHAPARRARR